jgi:hypothetical protein
MAVELTLLSPGEITVSQDPGTILKAHPRDPASPRPVAHQKDREVLILKDYEFRLRLYGLIAKSQRLKTYNLCDYSTGGHARVIK